MPRILYNVNIPRFFYTHRLPLALATQKAGYDVHVTTSSEDVFHVEKIKATTLPYHPLPLAQHGTSPISEWRTLQAMIDLYRELKPDIIHHVSIKPVLYGGIAARITGIPAVVSAMSGLGYVFVGDGLKPKLIRHVINPVLKMALSHHNTSMVFQNPEDQTRFINMGLIQPQNTVLIRGSGVDMAQFTPQPETDGLPIVLFAGRLMWQKGVGAFVEAARQLKGKARFVIVGFTEATAPGIVSQAELQAWVDEGILEWWGKRDDMPAVFAQSHIVCLPSTYGEGVPKVLIEAAACGRAIVTTDTAGCREITHHGVNGLLVAPNDQSALVDALNTLIANPARRQQMGEAGRQIAVNQYSLEQVIAETHALYETLLTKARI